MLDQSELCKYFTKSQQSNMIELDRLCMDSPPKRTRRTRIRKPKPGHVPRPVNSFMSYRAEKQSLIRKFCPNANHREISKIVAMWWHQEDPKEKAIYVSKAAAAKMEHSEKYPDYVFRPKSKKLKKKASSLITKKIKEIDFKPTLEDKVLPHHQDTSDFDKQVFQNNLGSEDFGGSINLVINNNVIQGTCQPGSSHFFMDWNGQESTRTIADSFNIMNDIFMYFDPQVMYQQTANDYYFKPDWTDRENSQCMFESLYPDHDMITPSTQGLETPMTDYAQDLHGSYYNEAWNQVMIQPFIKTENDPVYF